MTPVHEEVGAKTNPQEKQQGPGAEEVGPVLKDEEAGRSREEEDESEPRSGAARTAVVPGPVIVRVHDRSPQVSGITGTPDVFPVRHPFVG
jgi:hypothetical protein